MPSPINEVRRDKSFTQILENRRLSGPSMNSELYAQPSISHREQREELSHEI